MRLESALFSSREGLMSHGSALSVVGDNVSNSNTTGYKRVRTEFSDILAEVGGHDTSKAVAGNGASIARTRSIFVNGIVERTGRNLDAGIEGQGFFVLGEGEANTPTYYTRAGNFSLNSEGILVNPEGKPVLGYAAGGGEVLGPLDVRSVVAENTPTANVTIGGNLFSQSPTKAAPPEAPATFSELREASSEAQTVEVWDSLGNRKTIALYFTKIEGDRTWQVDAYVDGADVGGTAGEPTRIGGTTLVFDVSGAPSAGQTFTATAGWAGAAQANIAFDLSGFTQYGTPSSQTSTEIDGQATGQILNYEIQSNGSIIASLDNGSVVEVGVIAVATFNNPDALQRVGASKFRLQDGEANIGAPGTDGRGTLQGGALERSTVDLATEFTELVVLQRGYQASSQMLNAASTMIRETLDLLR